MAFAGVDMGEFGSCWEDRLPDRATRPQNQLIDRNYLLNAVKHDDRVHFASLLCLGVSGGDVAWVLERIREAGALAVIHDGVREVEGHADEAEVVHDFEKARHALHMRRTRAKKPKSK